MTDFIRNGDLQVGKGQGESINPDYTPAIGQPVMHTGESSFANPDPLNAENAFVIGAAELYSGETNLISTKTADVTNSDTSLNVGYDTTDRSAKFARTETSNKQDPAPGPKGAWDTGHTR